MEKMYLALRVATRHGVDLHEHLPNEAQVRRGFVVERRIEVQQRPRALQRVSRQPQLIHGVNVHQLELHTVYSFKKE